MRHGAEHPARPAEMAAASMIGERSAVNDRHARSFLLRIWLEPREVEGALDVVRGWARELQGGSELYFDEGSILITWLRTAVAGVEEREAQPAVESRQDAAPAAPAPGHEGHELDLFAIAAGERVRSTNTRSRT